MCFAAFFCVQNISVKNVPEVNLMGGVDPFLEAMALLQETPTCHLHLCVSTCSSAGAVRFLQGSGFVAILVQHFDAQRHENYFHLWDMVQPCELNDRISTTM